MSLQLVWFRADSGSAAEVPSHLERACAAIRCAVPQNVVSKAFSSEPGPDFVLALKLEELEEAAEIPLVGLPQAAQPQDLISRVLGAPVPAEPSTVVGAYQS